MKGLRRFFSTFAATLCHAVHAHNLSEILLLFYHNLTKFQSTFLTTKHFIRQLISYDCKFSLAMDLPACELGIKNIRVLSCGPWSRVRIPSAVKPCIDEKDTAQKQKNKITYFMQKRNIEAGKKIKKLAFSKRSPVSKKLRTRDAKSTFYRWSKLAIRLSPK